MLLLFNTEDHRSSFGDRVSGWPSGGPSQIPSVKQSGGASGGLQNKTSSSKNKGTRKSQKSFDHVISKKNNFMDEFDRFEEQFENPRSKDSSIKKKQLSVSHESKNQQSINQKYSKYMNDF